MCNIVKLHDVAVIAAGQNAPQGGENYCKNGTPFIKAGNLKELLGGKKESDIQNVNEEVAKKYKLKLYPAGTIVFAKSGMSCLKGYVYVLQSNCYVVSHLACVIPNKINGDYLKFYFEYHKPNELIKNNSYPSISLSDIGDIDIRVESFEIQSEIANNLNKLNSLIKHQKEQIKEINKLAGSQFVTLFNDQIVRDNKWTVLPVSQVINNPMSGEWGEDDPVGDGIKVIRTTNFTDFGYIDYSNVTTRVIELKKINSKTLCDGDIIVEKSGGTDTKPVGRVVYYRDKSEKYLFNNFTAVLRANKSIVLPGYLFQFLFISYWSGATKAYENKTTGIHNLRLKEYLNSQMIPIPPIDEQERFVCLFDKIDKSRTGMESRLEYLEKCYKTLLHKYFG